MSRRSKIIVVLMLILILCTGIAYASAVITGRYRVTVDGSLSITRINRTGGIDISIDSKDNTIFLDDVRSYKTKILAESLYAEVENILKEKGISIPLERLNYLPDSLSSTVPGRITHNPANGLSIWDSASILNIMLYSGRRAHIYYLWGWYPTKVAPSGGPPDQLINWQWYQATYASSELMRGWCMWLFTGTHHHPLIWSTTMWNQYSVVPCLMIKPGDIVYSKYYGTHLLILSVDYCNYQWCIYGNAALYKVVPIRNYSGESTQYQAEFSDNPSVILDSMPPGGNCKNCIYYD